MAEVLQLFSAYHAQPYSTAYTDCTSAEKYSACNLWNRKHKSFDAQLQTPKPVSSLDHTGCCQELDTLYSNSRALAEHARIDDIAQH